MCFCQDRCGRSGLVGNAHKTYKGGSGKGGEGRDLVRGEGKREDLVRGKVAKIRLSRAFS